MNGAILWAAAGTGFTFLMTSLGAATVFLFRGSITRRMDRILAGMGEQSMDELLALLDKLAGLMEQSNAGDPAREGDSVC